MQPPLRRPLLSDHATWQWWAVWGVGSGFSALVAQSDGFHQPAQTGIAAQGVCRLVWLTAHSGGPCHHGPPFHC